MEEVKYFTFARTGDNNISILNDWAPTDIEPASSLPRAALFVLNWANGGCAGQLDSEDIYSYLGAALHTYIGIPEGFVTSPNRNLVLAAFGKNLSEEELRSSAKQLFTFIDTYKDTVLANRNYLESLAYVEVARA